MPAEKIAALDGGTLDIDKGFMVMDPLFGQKTGKMIPIRIWQMFIEHREGKMIIDTSFDPKSHGIRPFGPRQTPEQRIDKQLAKLGLKTRDIDLVANTHLHVDHTGYNRMFKNASFLVQQAELAHCWHNVGTWPFCYDRSLYDIPDLRYEPVYGDRSVFDGVTLLSTPGHTPGHQSVYVETDKGKRMLYAGDACYLEENIGPPLKLAGIYYSAPDYLRSLERLRTIIHEKKAFFFPSHDDSFFKKKVRKLPEYYD
ncbi:MAG: N-acyl homoserine lactonase family protein [Candidatus Bathyarchaeia archaeon]